MGVRSRRDRRVCGHRGARATAGRRPTRLRPVLRLGRRRAGARRGRRRVDPGRAASHRRPDALVLVGQAADHGGRAPAVGAGAARARRSRRRVHRRLGQRQGAMHDPSRAHAHRRLPDVPGQAFDDDISYAGDDPAHRRLSRRLGAGHGGVVPPGDRLEGPRRDRRSGRRPADRPVPARRDHRAARHVELVARASRSTRKRSSAIASCRSRGPATGCRRSTATAR